MGVDLQDADLAGADISDSRLVGVDVENADFTNVTTTGAKAVADWSEAKVAPAILPQTMQPNVQKWLPPLIVGAILLVAVVLVRWRRGKSAQTEPEAS